MKPKPPILPGNKEDPTGTDRLERGAMLEMARRLRRATNVYRDVLNRISARPTINAKYEFALDVAVLMRLLDGAAISVDEILLEGGQDALWFFEAFGGVAYQRGTAQEFANLARQSVTYAAGSESLRQVLNTPEYRLRVGLIKARQFEEIKGLAGTVKADMSRLLTDGIARGLNPLEIARNLKEQTGIEEYRANRIARTEITTALRRARMDEADEASETYGLRHLQMHLSALSPTTRATHAARNGKLYTTDQQRQWWSEDGNSINCKCSTATVLVDKENKPIVPGMQSKLQDAFNKWKENHEQDE